ncbi:P-II family nitrogen regulator [Parasporobacterium paucivorans]|uniref:Nitrogen regulatory protein P-II family n=1 Tax=Parasporobacterium paucivorans DSM 15970 TaxID=1122934 RepID=A0A1M6K5X4_9FIRM|nr:P-II family nitrogen regulator [Parasporobacterium paucivorans]SHJ54323.1 nitrogen regulatory protein P-II family [Parasporobacterium paucivorans DSM 15970]
MTEKITKVDIITSPNRLEDLMDELDKIGVTGMTVSNVSGCGLQRGHKEYYRGTPVEIKLLAKVKVEIVICEIPVDKLVETVKKVLYTGNIGDGKIFVYDVVNVIRISDGTEGIDALR